MISDELHLSHRPSYRRPAQRRRGKIHVATLRCRGRKFLLRFSAGEQCRERTGRKALGMWRQQRGHDTKRSFNVRTLGILTTILRFCVVVLAVVCYFLHRCVKTHSQSDSSMTGKFVRSFDFRSFSREIRFRPLRKKCAPRS